jgi:hypothetical protein
MGVSDHVSSKFIFKLYAIILLLEPLLGGDYVRFLYLFINRNILLALIEICFFFLKFHDLQPLTRHRGIVIVFIMHIITIV